MITKKVLRVLVSFPVRTQRDYVKLNKFLQKAKPYSEGVYTSIQEERWSQ